MWSNVSSSTKKMGVVAKLASLEPQANLVCLGIKISNLWEKILMDLLGPGIKVGFIIGKYELWIKD